MNTKPSSKQQGFSTIQLLITLAVIAIVSSFAVVSISRARNRFRLTNSARQFGAYVERARADSIRRHADGANRATVSCLDLDTYSVTMDWDGFGNLTTRNFDLEQGVQFTTGVKSISFDWRGRIAGEESFGFRNPNASPPTVNINVSGSGDVTFDLEIFLDTSIPTVTVTGGGGVMPEPGASPQSSPSPGASPSPSPGQSPAPSPSVNPSPGVSPNPSPQVSPNPSPGVSPSPVVSPNPSPNPSPVVCSLSTEPTSLSIVSDGAAPVNVNLNNFTGNGTIYATSSNSGQIQVSPSSRAVSGTASVSFTVTVKRNGGSVTFSANGCGSTVVPVAIR